MNDGYKERIFFAGPWVTEHEVEVVTAMLRNGWYEHPYDYCEKFQDEFAAYHGRKYGIMTPNCTTAIHLLLTGLGIGEGDEVILPDCTWIASGAGITYLRATPVFCDIDRVHWCMEPDSLAKQITHRTKAIIVVDLFGNMPLMDEIRQIANEKEIPLIEDAAEALGSTYKGVKAGMFGIGSVFSFHRTKTITTGEGGMLLLDDEKLYERCMFLRDHGRKSDGGMYYNYEVTYKYMPSNYQAALGYAQFQRIEEILLNKRKQLQLYREFLGDIDNVELNPDPVDGIHGGWMPTIVIGKSYKMRHEEVIQKMAKYNIPCRPFFYPLSSLPAYEGFREKYEVLNPQSYNISQRGVNLPCAGNLTEKQIQRVCDCMRKVLGAEKNDRKKALQNGNNSDIRLNLGCGGRPLEGYINVDKDNLEELRVRYPIDSFPDGIEVHQYDIFNLPFSDKSVAEVRTDSLIEHLSFSEEPKFFFEVQRILRPGGLFSFSTTDFEEIMKIWINAKDDWKDFYRNDEEAIRKEHWFGQYSYAIDNRWGYLTAIIYGPQNSEGQFHKNCYTLPKIRAILKRLEFEELSIKRYLWKGDKVPMFQVQAKKQGDKRKRDMAGCNPAGLNGNKRL